MALYTAPSVSELAAKVRRSLRDGNSAVFEPEQVIDFINTGLSELSLIRPLETNVVINTLDGLAGLDDDPDAVTISDLDYIWSVEVYGLDGTVYEGLSTIVSPEDSSTNWRNGWDFVGGTLSLPVHMTKWLDEVWSEAVPTHAILVRGYRHRRRVDTEDDGLDLFSLPEEEATVVMAQKAGFEALLNDRALYQQWQVATGATDVSPTQLTNMAQGALVNWERMRKHLYLIRRPLVGAQ